MSESGTAAAGGTAAEPAAKPSGVPAKANTTKPAAGRLQSIQYLRGVGTVLVVAGHIIGRYGLGFAASVDTFFVVSGVVMWLVIDGEDVKPLRFAYDRWARILPFYWLCTVSLASAALLLPQLFSRLHLTAPWVASSLVLLPYYQPGTSDIFPVLTQGWTLSYELFFYAVLFAATFAPRRRRLLVVSGILFAFLAVGLCHTPASAAARVFTNPLLAEFLLGFWFGKAFSAGKFPTSWAAALLMAAGLAALVIAALHGENPDGWRRVAVWGCPALALVAGCVGLEATRRRRDVPIGLLLGEASYAIYLTHGMFISVLTHIWKVAGLSDAMHGAAFAATGIVVCTLGGLLVHLVVERPLLEALRRFYKTRSRARPGPLAAQVGQPKRSPADLSCAIPSRALRA